MPSHPPYLPLPRSNGFFNAPGTYIAGSFTGFYYANVTAAPGFFLTVTLLYAHMASGATAVCTMVLDGVRGLA